MVEVGPRSPEVTCREVLGRRLRVVRWPARTAARARPLLVFNGIGANAELIGPLAERLRGRDVVTFDLPGVGGSPPPRLPYRPRTVVRLGDRLMSDLGYGSIDVLGVSWGGAIAQQYAFEFRGRVGRMVLIATSPGAIMVPGRFRAVRRLMTPHRYIDPDYVRRHFSLLYGGGGEGIEAHLARIRPPTVRGYLFQLLAITGWTSVGILPFVGAETLILMGENDPIVRPLNGRLLEVLLRRAACEVVPGAGHLFPVTHAETAARRIRAFLDHAA